MGHQKRDTEIEKGNGRADRQMKEAGVWKRRYGMKGYYVNEGYMGYVDGSYRLFADESDYLELMREEG